MISKCFLKSAAFLLGKPSHVPFDLSGWRVALVPQKSGGP